jgi:DHA1 family bicyclomycin/chloramphenicol resistance-like MFS transporter
MKADQSADQSPGGLGMSRAFLVMFTGLLLALNAFSCDITLPAFWSMERSLGAPIEHVQAVIPVFLFCSAIGQLVFGPASDAYGRKPIILAGVALYIAGALIAAAADTLTVALYGRALQGFGSACGAVIARALLRDVHSGPELARTMAFASSVIALGPIVAPLVGYGLVVIGEWRGVFIGMAIYGAGLAAMVLTQLQETNKAPDRSAIAPARLASAIARVFANRQSRYFVLLSGINSFAILSYVTNAPRLYKNAFDVEGLAFTAMFAATGAGIVAGQYLNARLISRLGVMAATRSSALVLASTAILIAILSVLGWISLGIFAGLMLIYNASFLMVMSNAVSLVIDPHREIAGVASSTVGFVSQFVSSILVFATLPLFQGALVPWSLGMVVVTVIVALAVVAYRPRSDH